MMEMNVTTTLDQIDAEEAALTAQVIALRGRKAEARERELGSKIEQAQALINRYGITNDQLTFPPQPIIPMYRDPISDETWSGKGNAPLWTKGKPLEQFLNPEWVAKKAKEEKAKAARETKKAERAAKKAEKDAAKANKCREQTASADAKQAEGVVRQPAVMEGSTASNDAATMANGGESPVIDGSVSQIVAHAPSFDLTNAGSNTPNAQIVSNLN